MKELDGKSDNIVERNFAELARIFPEAASEGKIKWDELKATLGEEITNPDDRYGLNWKGKSDVFATIQQRTSKTFKLDTENSENPTDTGNMFIEGDNLEALKILHKAYYGKVKMIYIDPPYNTGNDFVYSDKFAENRRDYLAETGEIDNEGFATRTDGLRKNSRDNGHFHSNWLNMMYPRLYLARNLLRTDGVIFISIDDNEVANLRLIMDEIFGAENFVGHIHWRRRSNQPNDPTKAIGLVAEHILVFARNEEKYKESGVGKIEVTGSFSNPDNDVRGNWASKPWKSGTNQSGTRYEIVSPSGAVFNEEWLGSKETYDRLLSDGRIHFPSGGNGNPRKKYYENERQEEGQSANNWWSSDEFGNNQDATSEIKNLFDGKLVFQNPKPTKLIKNLMGVANVKNDDVVLDFFSGSGTTSCAVMEYNDANSTNINWLTVQLPENLDENMKTADSKTKPIIQNAIQILKSLNKPHVLSNIATERIRRAGVKVGKGDTDFKLYKVSASNFKKWNEHPADVDELRQQALDHLNPLVDGVNDGDLLVELLLKNGISPLDAIENHGTWSFVPSANLAICLSRNITTELFSEILSTTPAKVILLDLGFNNDSQLKANILLQADEKDVEVEVA